MNEGKDWIVPVGAISSFAVSPAAALFFGVSALRLVGGKRRRKLARELARARSQARACYRRARGHHLRWLHEAGRVQTSHTVGLVDYSQRVTL
jgi:hypothetical protein